jgi:LysR family transcriptional regulator of gallate degradation
MARNRTTSTRIDPRLLAYFHTVARIGNVTRAAAELNIAQPTLSKALALLESQIGAELFVRHPHGVTLTPIGARLQRHAVAIRAQISKAEEEIRDTLAGVTGHVRIGAGPSWVRRFLPEAIAGLLVERRGISFEVVGGFDGSLLTGLLTGDLDFVVAELPSEPNDDFQYRPLTSDALVVVARPEHPFFARAPLGLDEVLAARWALSPTGNLARSKLDGRLTSLGKPTIRPVITSSSQTFLMTIAGMTDVLLYPTRSLLRSPEGSHLRELDVPDLVTSRDAGLIFRAGAAVSPAAEVLAERLRDLCRASPRN